MICACCGKPLKKRLHLHWVVSVINKDHHYNSTWCTYHAVAEPPQTVQECQALVTDKVMIQGNRHRFVGVWTEGTKFAAEIKASQYGTASFISHFSTWDGVSYDPVYDYFCTTRCAAVFGRLAWEKTNLRTKAWHEAQKAAALK